MIKKGNIILREPREDDLNIWYRWLNDPEITKYQNKGKFPNTKNKQREYMMKMQESHTDVLFAIVHEVTGRHVGCVGLHNIDWINRSANLGIMIGCKDYWKKGIGKLVWNMITKHGLFTLNLHRIYADCFVENKATVKIAQASGFKIEGNIRDKYYKDGKWYDAIIMSVLKDEFKEVKV
jgi:RimJ/RimL family protein N-acetyltransferase